MMRRCFCTLFFIFSLLPIISLSHIRCPQDIFLHNHYLEPFYPSSCNQDPMIIDNSILICGSAVINKCLKIKRDAVIQGRLKVRKKARFKKNVVIDGILSAENINIHNNVSLQNVGINGFLQLSQFVSPGILHNNAAGIISSSLIVNADVDPSAAIVDTKLATIATAGKVANSATTATSINTANTIVVRDGSGNFSTNMISLSGPVINSTDAATKAYVDASVPSSGSSDNIPNTLVLRDGAGGFSAGSVSFSDGVISNAMIVIPFTTSGIVHNDASGLLSSSLIVNTDIDSAAGIVDTKLTTISTAGKVANSATTATAINTPNTIVLRDSSGNFSAGTITADLIGNASTATIAITATNATNFTGSLSGDVTGTQSATVVSSVGGQTAGNVAAGTALANAATSANSANAIVRRDASGNFITTMITIAGAVTNPTDVATKSYVDAAVIPSVGTNLNIPNTLVQRDNTGSFAAQAISITDTVLTGNLYVGNSINNSMGNFLKNGVPFIHNYGTNNTFVGSNAGNFTNSGIGRNSAFGVNALSGITNGINNIAIGYQAGQALTIGSGNVYINANAASGSENSTIRIGSSQIACFIAGITGTGVSGDAVVIDNNGQLGITLSSKRFKHDIQDMCSCSEIIYQLRPVTFIYIDDVHNTKQYGLIAEEVDAVFPAIVAKDKDGIAYTVRYHLLPILLLNELQKQNKTIINQQKQLDELEKYKAIIEELRSNLNDLRSQCVEYFGKTIAQ